MFRPQQDANMGPSTRRADEEMQQLSAIVVRVPKMFQQNQGQYRSKR